MPERIFSLVQSGYAADFILELGVDSLNGLRNRVVTLGYDRPADTDFLRVLDLLREIQIAGAVSLRVERSADGAPATVLFFRSERLAPDDAATDREPLLKVNSGIEKPNEAFVAVPYADRWFWIANNDLRSKRTFTAVLFMFTVADAGGAESLPTITIPAQ